MIEFSSSSSVTFDFLEVLTARQSLLSAQLQQVANRFTELQSVVTLYHALGGGRETEAAQ